jgi:hypothetical protein
MNRLAMTRIREQNAQGLLLVRILNIVQVHALMRLLLGRLKPSRRALRRLLKLKHIERFIEAILGWLKWLKGLIGVLWLCWQGLVVS